MHESGYQWDLKPHSPVPIASYGLLWVTFFHKLTSTLEISTYKTGGITRQCPQPIQYSCFTVSDVLLLPLWCSLQHRCCIRVRKCLSVKAGSIASHIVDCFMMLGRTLALDRITSSECKSWLPSSLPCHEQTAFCFDLRLRSVRRTKLAMNNCLPTPAQKMCFRISSNKQGLWLHPKATGKTHSACRHTVCHFSCTLAPAQNDLGFRKAQTRNLSCRERWLIKHCAFVKLLLLCKSAVQ